MREKKVLPFSCKFRNQFGWNTVCCHNMLVCWSSCYIVFGTSTIQGRELYWLLWNVCLTSSCVRILVNAFLSNLVWCYTLLNFTVWFQFELPCWSLKVTLLQESWNLCSHSVVKLHEAAHTFVMVTVKMSRKHGEYGSFEHLLFLFFWAAITVRNFFSFWYCR